MQLQTYFRFQAENIQAYFQNDIVPGTLEPAFINEPLNAMLTKDSLVDSAVLMQIWPEELNSFRVCIQSLNTASTTTSLCVYTPLQTTFLTTDETWTGKDIILHLQHRHFQLMTFTTASGVLPIDELTAWGITNHIHVQKFSIQSTGGIQTTLQNYVYDNTTAILPQQQQQTYGAIVKENRRYNSLQGIMSRLTSKEITQKYGGLLLLIEEGKEAIRILHMQGIHVDVQTLLENESFQLPTELQEYYDNEMILFIHEQNQLRNDIDNDIDNSN